MLEIDRMHTTVGSVREGDYDIELEELDFKVLNIEINNKHEIC